MTEPREIDLVFSNDPKSRADGWRLHVFRREGEGLIWLADERVLPERVDLPEANNVLESRRIMLTTDEQRWLRDVLSDALIDNQPSEETP